MSYHISSRWIIHMGSDGPATATPVTWPSGARGSSALHRSILISRSTLAGHGSVQSGIEVGGAVGPCISGGDSFGNEVCLFPTRFSVDFSQLLMYPHGVENLASELDHTGREPLTVPGDHHQPIDSACLQQWPVNKEWYHDTQIIHFHWKIP